jgi:hypothetical protein
LEPKTIDRLSWALVNVRPRLSSVTSPGQLRSWAAAVEQAAAAATPEDALPRPCAGGGAAVDRAAPSSSEAFGLRYWEQALSEALARLQAHGNLRPEADVTALGSAFAAMLYGGLLLSQTTGTSLPLQAALDMALGQISALGAE